MLADSLATPIATGEMLTSLAEANSWYRLAAATSMGSMRCASVA
ncbi:MAG: hypothetical protein R3D03_15575 [Geminicoccaceae bacterium]